MSRRELSQYTEMTEAEAVEAVTAAIRLHLHRLPQMKGKGKLVDSAAREAGA